MPLYPFPPTCIPVRALLLVWLVYLLCLAQHTNSFFVNSCCPIFFTSHSREPSDIFITLVPYFWKAGNPSLRTIYTQCQIQGCLVTCIARTSYLQVHFGCGKSKDLPLTLPEIWERSQQLQKTWWSLERNNEKILGVVDVELGLQKALSGSWGSSGLQKSSLENARNISAQTKISLMAEIRVSLYDLVSIATLWLLLWEKGWE